MRLYPKTREEAEFLKGEYEFLGMTAFIDGDALVVVTKGKKKKKKEKKDGSKTVRRVDKRKES